MKGFTWLVFLCVAVAVYAVEEPEEATEVVRIDLDRPPYETWIAIHGGVSSDFAGYFGGCAGASLNWIAGGNGIYLGTGYTFTGGGVSSGGISGDIYLHQFMGLVGYGYYMSDMAYVVGLHLGLTTLSGTLTQDEETASGTGSVFGMGVIGIFNVMIGETGGIHVEMRTNYLLGEDAYSKLYSLHIGYAFGL